MIDQTGQLRTGKLSRSKIRLKCHTRFTCQNILYWRRHSIFLCQKYIN